MPTEVLRILRQKPLVVAGGTVEAATAHITAVAARLKLVNQQIKQAHRQLDELSDKLAESREEDASGQKSEQRDVTILRSLPGVGRIVLATLLGEAAEPLRKRDYHALRTLSDVAPVTRRSGKRCVVLMRQACHLRLRTAVYHWARVAIQHDARSRARYANCASAVTAMAAPCAASPTASSPSPVPCSKPKPPSTQNMPSRLPLPEPSSHPLVRSRRPSLRPDLPPGRARRAVEVTPKGAQRSGAPRLGAVDGTSTALHYKGPRRRPAGLEPRKALDYWWGVPLCFQSSSIIWALCMPLRVCPRISRGIA